MVYFCGRMFLFFMIGALWGTPAYAAKKSPEAFYRECMAESFGDADVELKEELCGCGKSELKKSYSGMKQVNGLLHCFETFLGTVLDAKCKTDPKLDVGLAEKKRVRVCECVSSTAASDFLLVAKSNMRVADNPEEAIDLIFGPQSREMTKQNLYSATEYCMRKL